MTVEIENLRIGAYCLCSMLRPWVGRRVCATHLQGTSWKMVDQPMMRREWMREEYSYYFARWLDARLSLGANHKFGAVHYHHVNTPKSLSGISVTMDFLSIIYFSPFWLSSRRILYSHCFRKEKYASVVVTYEDADCRIMVRLISHWLRNASSSHISIWIYIIYILP